MNFLAHALLSSFDGEILLGNLMADFLKPGVPVPSNERVRLGIQRHYSIDHFMDTHPLVARSRARLFPSYRHYSAVLVDVFYDHLLATNWEDFCEHPLPEFASWVYGELDVRHDLMPPRMLNVIPAMRKDNWLVSYAQPTGVRYALQRVHHRSPRAPEGDEAWEAFDQEKSLYEAEFLEFFPQVLKLCGM